MPYNTPGTKLGIGSACRRGNWQEKCRAPAASELKLPDILGERGMQMGKKEDARRLCPSAWHCHSLNSLTGSYSRGMSRGEAGALLGEALAEATIQPFDL